MRRAQDEGDGAEVDSPAPWERPFPGVAWGSYAVLVGMLLLAVAIVVPAVALSPALAAALPSAGGSGPFVTLALLALFLSLSLTGLALVGLGSAFRRVARALGALDRIENRLAGYLRVEEVPEEVRSGRYLRDMRERDARYLTIESLVSDVPRVREELTALADRLDRAALSLYDPVTGERRNVPLRFGGRGPSATPFRIPDGASVRDVEGVGEEHADVLRRAGYATVGDLRRSDADVVSERTGIDLSLVRRWQDLVAGRAAGRAFRP